MAKSMNFFGQKSGSTKSLTFQIRDGKQIVKDRVWKVRNPRSEFQMAQRCRVATAAQAYRAMREIVDHSFEGMSGKSKNYARFQKLALLAMGANPSNFSYAPWGDKEFRPGAYVMSEGSMNALEAWTPEVSGNNLILKSNVTGGTATEKGICDALGLQQIGDMVTVCYIVPSEVSGYVFGFIRITLTGVPSSSVLAADSALSCVAYYAPTNTKFENLKYTATIANVHFVITAIPNGYLTPGAAYVGTCAINSRKVNDGYVYSPAQIVMGSGWNSSPDFATAVATYPTGESYVLQGGGGSVQ